MIEILHLYLRARLQLTRRSLPEVVKRFREAPRSAPSSNPAAAFRLAWAVERVLGSLPADSRCLVRSVVLVGLLARRSVPSTLVIGVRPGEPFAAHAWVEADGRPLLPSGEGEFERLTEV